MASNSDPGGLPHQSPARAWTQGCRKAYRSWCESVTKITPLPTAGAVPEGAWSVAWYEGLHVGAPHPPTGNATSSPLVDVTYTRDPATVGADNEPPTVPVHVGAHVVDPQPPAGKAESTPSEEATNTVVELTATEVVIAPPAVPVQAGSHSELPHPAAGKAYTCPSEEPTYISLPVTVALAPTAAPVMANQRGVQTSGNPVAFS